MTRSGWTGRLALALVAMLSTGPASAGEQAERALDAVRKLIASGELRRDSNLKVAFKQGNINALLGPNLELQKEWERQTGIVISARLIPQQPAVANLRNSPDIDLTVARNNEYPDLLQQGLVEDLGPLLTQFGFTMGSEPLSGFIRPALQARLAGRTVAIPADGDLGILFLRRDLLEDPAEQAAFRKATGQPLAVPRTWADYLRLVRFFHRPEKNLFGSVEQRDPGTAWMFWLPRYLSQAAPYAALFDERMRPLIDSPAGIAATENYVAITRHTPPGSVEDGKDYSFTLPFFVQGKAFSSVWTIAGAKLFNSANSAVRGRFIAVPLPGQEIGGRLVRHNPLIYGNNLVVSSRSTQRKLAFLFAMWLTDPDISTRTVGVSGGFTDPYRWHHLRDARIRELYTAQAVEVSSAEWAVAVPPGTGLPGDGEYLDALNRYVSLAARGEIGAREAMRRTAAEWEKLTEKYGRERQIEAWRAFRAGFARPEAGNAQ